MQRTIFEDEHELFRETVRGFVDDVFRPRHDEIAAAHGIPRDLWLDAGKLGLLGLSVGEEFGGGGCRDFRFNAVLGEELAMASMALASSVGIQVDVATPYLVDLTTPAQRERWLPGFVTGEIVTAMAMTEPSGGSDLAAIKTMAVPDGDGWILNGSKTFITNGGSADLFIVPARTASAGGSRNISLFLVESTMDGFHRGRVLDKVGQPESDTSEIFFHDLRLSRQHLLGELDQGFRYMMERLPQERIAAAVTNIANTASVLEETMLYAKGRVAFGKPIGSFQHNRFVLADLVTRVDVTRAFVDQCVLAHARGELTAVDAAKAKWWTAEVQNQALDACLQLHGGYGYMREYRVARAWMDARVTKIWAGSNEIMKEVIGRSLGF